MAVSFQTTLADSDLDGTDGHEGLVVTGRDVAQNDPLVGADNAFYKGRGNSVFTVSFSARKVHASVANAISYCGSHVKATRGNGTFTGFGLTLTNATCVASVRHEAGVMTRASYEITGTEANA